MASTRFLLGVGLSAGLHVVAYVQMSHAKASAPKAPPVVIEVDTSAPPPRPPPPPPATNEPAPDAPAPAAAKARSAPAPKAAQAGKVLAAKDDAQPSAMADFTMVQGTGTYAGGVTTSAGTSRNAVSQVVASTTNGGGGGGGTGTGTAPGARDLSKPARPVGDNWDCSALYPRGASIDSTTVVIVVRVSARGAAESVSIVKDPGQGFGAAARACAMKQRYAAAEDREGNATVATTAPFRVRFTR